MVAQLNTICWGPSWVLLLSYPIIHPDMFNFSLHGQTSVVIRANTVNWGLPTNLLQYTMMTSAFVSNCSFDNVIAQYDTMITSACREMTSANSVRQRCKNDAMITSANSNFHPNIDYLYVTSVSWFKIHFCEQAQACAKFGARSIFRILFIDSNWSFLQRTWNLKLWSWNSWLQQCRTSMIHFHRPTLFE